MGIIPYFLLLFGLILLFVGLALWLRRYDWRERQTKSTENKHQEIVGIDGWLLFFIFTIIANSIIIFIDGFQLVMYTAGYFFFYGFYEIILTILGVMSIMALFKKRRSDLIYPKMFLIGLLIQWPLFVYILSVVTETSSGYNAGSTIFMIFYPLIWLAYLINSKRVKNTYK